MSLCGAEVVGWKPGTVDKAFNEIVAGLVAGALDGTDISGWQPTDPPLAGDAFSIIKASEGVGAPNANWAGQVDWCRSAGALVGHYHFANGLNTAVAEAQFFWDTIKGKWQSGQPCALDIEGTFFSNAANPVQWALQFAQAFFALSGLKILIYIDWQHEKNAAYNWQPLVDYNCGLWGAAYNSTGFGDPSPWPFCVIWQNADTNVSGGDSDVLNGDASTFIAYGTPAAPAPAPAPGGFLMALTDQQQTDLYNRVMGGIPGGSAVGRSGRILDTGDLGSIADTVLNRAIPWYGFDGKVPTTGRTTTTPALALGFTDAVGSGINGHTDTAVKNIPVPQITLTDAQVQTFATQLKQELPAATLQALVTAIQAGLPPAPAPAA